MSELKNKRVLVTGSEGMIGKELVEQLENLGAEVFYADMRTWHIDLREFKNCYAICRNIDYVFHLAGIKGNPKMTNERPYDFMCPMLQMDTNMIRAAHENNVKRFLYTSSIAVENIKTDFYPAWAKLTAEHLINALKKQGTKTKFCVVRPANVYGRFDNFKNPDAMVITSLIFKALKYEKNWFSVWGNGSQIRDFINAKDVASGMIKAISEMPNKPVNLCSGKGISIKKIAEIISRETNKTIKYDKSKPSGAKKRIMKLNWDFKPKIDIQTGIKEVIDYARYNWY